MDFEDFTVKILCSYSVRKLLRILKICIDLDALMYYNVKNNLFY